MPIPDEEWSLLVDRIQDGLCVPFLGAGASIGANAPSAAKLAETLAVKCHFPGRDKWDFLKVAQYYRMTADNDAPRREIQKYLRNPAIRPTPAHEALAALPFKFFITTNYDRLVERALENQGKQPVEMTYRIGTDRVEIAEIPTTEKPIVYHIHGILDDLPSMIVTEDDMVDWMAAVLTSDPPLPTAIRALFSQSVLFIGYALTDWNIRVLLRAIRGPLPSRVCISIQKEPEDPVDAELWNRLVAHLSKNELRCYSMDAGEFITELKRRFDAAGGGARGEG